MADTLKFRGLSTAEIDLDSVATREIVIDLEVNQLVIGGNGGTFSFYNSAQIDALLEPLISDIGGEDGGVSVDDLTNVDLQNLVYGDVLSWNGANWTNSGVDISRSTISNLGDVNISGTPAVGDYIIWNGLEWVNYAAPSVVNLSDTLVSAMGASNTYQSLAWDGTNWINQYIPLTAASDVDTSGVTAGQRLEYNGTQWVAVPNDADTLDTIDSTQFLRSDVVDYKTNGALVFEDAVQLSFGTTSDADFFFTGSTLYLDLNGGANDFLIRDNNTTRFTFTKTGNLTATGSITAGTLLGDGSSITDLNASNISSGTVNDAYLPATITSDITGNAASADTIDITASSTNTDYRVTFGGGTGAGQTLLNDGNLTYNPATNTLTAGFLTGNGSTLGSLNASNISSGTINDARLPATISSDITGNAATASQITVGDTVDLNIDCRVLLSTGTGTKSVVSDGQLKFNASTNVLTAGSFSGSMAYSNLTGTPTIPTNNNQLINGAGYITNASIPTATSDLTNDSGFITDITTQTDPKYLRSDTADTAAGSITFTANPRLNNDVRINFGTSSSISLRRDATNLIMDIPNSGTFFIRDT
ncbi:long tail fiber protein [Synechococcus phage S-CREM2]|nr:long tail fiber protein [Synechococcus phage S-CREM2]